MAIRPSHAERRFTATRVFTDREGPRSVFLTALETSQPTDSYRVLTWYGVGGQGKTALCREFQKLVAEARVIAANRASHRRIGWAVVDFDTPRHRNLLEMLLALRLQLSRSGRIPFPAFDTAFARYFALDNPGASMRQRHPELFTRESELLNDVLLWGKAGIDTTTAVAGALVPGANVLYKHAARLTGRLRAWWARRGREVLAGLDELRADQILARLPTYLGSDLAFALTDEPTPRIVVMLDTYEALWRDLAQREGAGALRADDWVRLLVQECPGVLFVILGRDRLRWGEIDADWDTIVEQHRLGALSGRDADSFLEAVPIEDAAIRRRIVDGARGLPFYLDLQVDHFAALADAGRAPKPEDFGGSHPVILARFLDHLGEVEERVLRLAAYPDALDERLANRLAERFLGGAGVLDWPRLTRRGFMTALPDGRLAMHALMRETLLEADRSARPDLWRRVHAALFEWLDADARAVDARSVTPETEAAFLAAQRHLRAADPERLVPWTLDRAGLFERAARWHTLETAVALALAAEAETAPIAPTQRAVLLAWLGWARRGAGRTAEAVAPLEEAIAVHEGAGSAGDTAHAQALGCLAAILRDLGRYAEAQARLEQVLALEEAALGPDDPRLAPTLGNLAIILRQTGRYAEAERQLERVRDLCAVSPGPTHPDYAAALGNLAGVYRDTGRYEEAARCYAEARPILEAAYGELHPAYAVVLNNIAGVERDRGRLDESEGLYRRVLEIQEAALGTSHPAYATTLNNLAGVHRDLGRLDAAERLYDRVRETYEATIGRDHPSYAAALHNLAGVYQETGRLAEAEALCDTALDILARTLPPTHPHLGRVLFRRGELKLRAGRREAAVADLGRALACLEPALGTAHPWVAEARAALERAG